MNQDLSGPYVYRSGHGMELSESFLKRKNYNFFNILVMFQGTKI